MKLLRKIATLLLALLSVGMSAKTSSGKPDFAYPATVSKEAKMQLDEAVKKKNAYSAIEALLKYEVSQSLIDEDNVKDVIKLTESTAQKFARSDFSGIFDAMLAKFYYSYYNENPWTYNQRELPLTPYPEDISEWSGEQFKQKITDLALASVEGKKGRALAELKTKDYEKIINVSADMLPFYPTLLDFAYSNAIELMSYIDNDKVKDALYGEAIAASDASSAPYILFTTDYFINKNKSKELIENFDSYVKNRYVSYILVKLYNNQKSMYYEIDIDDEDAENNQLAKQKATINWIYQQCCLYLENFPGGVLLQDIKSIIDSILNPVAICTYRNTTAPGIDLDVKVNARNTGRIKLKLYSVSGERAKNGIKASTLSSAKPVSEIIMDFTNKKPFTVDTIAKIRINAPGYYVIVPEVDGKVDKDDWLSTVRCVPVMPITLSKPVNPLIAVTDPITGAPITDAAVVVSDNGKPALVKRYTVDKIGVVMPDLPDKHERYNVKLMFQGKEYDFSENYFYKFATNRPTSYSRSASILTDKAIYHTGEKVQALVVLTIGTTDSYNKVTKSVAPNVPVNVKLLDANRQKVAELSGTTDDMGRYACEFDLPDEGLTGNYRIVAESTEGYDGSQSIMVSDYKMPEFQLNIGAVARNVPAKGDVTISGDATTYSGMPVAGASVEMVVSSTIWRFWSYNSRQKVYSASTVTDGDGRFSITVPDSVLSLCDNKFFIADINATSINGSAVSQTASFSTGKQYLINMSIADSNIDALQPFRPEVKVYAPDGETVQLPLKWRLERAESQRPNKSTKQIVASGDFTGMADLSAITPGVYRFIIESADPELADETSECIYIYNLKTDIVPGDKPIWLLEDEYSHPKGKNVEILFGTPENDTYVYQAVVWDNKVQSVKNVKCDKGYHTIKVDVPDDVAEAYVAIFTMRNFECCNYNIRINTRKDNNLKVVGEAFRDKLQPGADETWKFRITKSDGTPCRAAVALDMYNKALDALQTAPFTIRFTSSYTELSPSVNCLRYFNICNNYMGKAVTRYTSLANPSFMFIDESFGRWSNVVVTGYGAPSGAMRYAKAMNMAAPAIEEAVEFETADAADDNFVYNISPMDGGILSPDKPAENFDYRESEVTLAVWAPMLTTDDEGNLTYSFTVPNANTTWRLQAVAWTKDAYAGNLVRDFVASKAVMVQPNLPRFLRAGDKAVVLASVMNNTDEAATINTVIELFNPYTSEIIATEKCTNEVDGKASATVAINVSAPNNIDAIGYRVRSSNGAFSDGEQAVIRILPNENTLIETTPFYLNPGETEYSTTLPKGKDARISLTFCENPAWTIVTALPGLRTEIDDYANSAAAALFSACIARGIVKENPAIGKAIKMWQENPTDSALVSMLEKNEDLKIALLNSTPWVQAAQSDTERMANLTLLFDEKQTDASIKKALDILADLQQSDGGWKWGKWCDESSEWVTGNVLTMLAKLKTLGWLPDDNRINDMANKALRFWDKKVDPRYTDVIYSIVRPQFTELTIGSNGKKVIDKTIAEIRKDWKEFNLPSYKAMAAEALYINNDKKLAGELMRSISEFGVWTPSQGLRFPSVDALYSYGLILEAYAMIQPESKEVDGLRQQLIVRKQGTNWGSAVVTTEVVQSILSSGSDWIVDASGASVQVGNKTIAPTTPIETATGNIRADLSAYQGKTLTVTTSGAGPAYGAVYAQFSQLMSDVKASGCDDLDIEKVMYKREGLEWVPAADMKVGDRVKVQLTIHCKRNLQYVEIIDERPAAFEPADQLPGWVWSEGTRFYRENRDSRTQLHVQWLNPGTYLLTYEMNVNTAGTYSSGVASIQSQYAPELSAHSSGCQLQVSCR